jgi:hypothetical protein
MHDLLLWKQLQYKLFLMYTLNRLEWHLDDEPVTTTPQGTVWSCRIASEAFGRFNRLAVALAKSQDHRASCGVFAFGVDRQGALANSLHGLYPRNTDTATHPADCRPALIERLVKNWVQRWKQGPIYKRINPSSALGRFLFF